MVRLIRLHKYITVCRIPFNTSNKHQGLNTKVIELFFYKSG